MNTRSILKLTPVVLIIGLGLLAGVFWYLNQKGLWPERTGKITPEELAPERELTKEEILERLSAPSDAPQRTFEEKKAILESLSSPGESGYSGEEKKQILDSLSAPIAE